MFAYGLLMAALDGNIIFLLHKNEQSCNWVFFVAELNNKYNKVLLKGLVLPKPVKKCIHMY